MELDGKELRLIDAHGHMNFNAYKDDADDVIRRCIADGVGMITVGSQSTTSERAAEMAAATQGMWSVIGLHPIHLFRQEVDDDEVSYVSREEAFDPAFYRELAGRYPKVVAIGECGLDYYRMPEGVAEKEVRRRQEEAFRRQIDLATELGLPLMIHIRDAHDDVIRVLSGYADAGMPLRGDIHCFSGGIAEAERYVELGFHISFTGNLTYKPRKADVEKGETLQDVARRIPLDRILVETDAPYLSPVPHRGKRNEPRYVKYIAGKLAEIKGMTVEEVERVTLENTVRLFGLT